MPSLKTGRSFRVAASNFLAVGRYRPGLLSYRVSLREQTVGPDARVVA